MYLRRVVALQVFGVINPRGPLIRMSGSSGDIKQIFLSHCVESMGVHALALNERLRSNGYSTFVCTTMSAGQQFRREITVNAANCKVRNQLQKFQMPSRI